jgi:hypothetical protein
MIISILESIYCCLNYTMKILLAYIKNYYEFVAIYVFVYVT